MFTVTRVINLKIVLDVWTSFDENLSEAMNSLRIVAIS